MTTFHVPRCVCLLFPLVLAALSACARDGSAAPLLVVPEARGHRLVLIDPRAKAVAGAIAVPGWPHEVAFSADGKTAYTPSYSDAIVGMPGEDGHAIDVIDMATRTWTKSWDLGRPLRPHKVLVAQDGSLLVSAELAQAVAIVDARTGRIAAQIPTGAAQTHMLEATPDGRKLYTANLGAGSISVLDLKTRKLTRVIAVSDLVQRIALSRDGKRLFVTNGNAPSVVVIDTATDDIAREIPVAGFPFAACPTADGKFLLVGEDEAPLAHGGGTKGLLEVIDLAMNAVAHRFDTDRMPHGIAIVGDEAFIATWMNGNVDVLNLKAWALEAPIAAAAYGDGIALWPGLR
ncbi:MAG: cytochrome D1 domain-containing protein [Solimonas sp.]